MADDWGEERAVEISELQSGVATKAGHPLVLLAVVHW